MAKMQPTHTLYVLPDAGAKDGKWLQAGAAWLNRDGSINAILNQAVEKGTRVQLRKRKAKE